LGYRSNIDPTDDMTPSLIPGSQNVMTSNIGTMERYPGFSDNTESAITSFSAVAREFRWSKWGGSTYLSVVSDLVGGVAKVYWRDVGTTTPYALLYTSSGSDPFDFVVSNNMLYMGNGVDMRAWDGVSASTRKWGITRPSVVATLSLGGTGISAASGYYYRYTYVNSTTGHESSASDLSACTGQFSNQTVTVTVTYSTDTQVDQINIYRTTDAGSTDPTLMKLVTTIANNSGGGTVGYSDSTSDSGLSTRTAPTTTSNDPPTPCSKLVWAVGRIWGANNATTYFSGQEELNGYSVPEESWPSGVAGNSYPWDKQVTAQAPLPDGLAVFTRSDIYKIEGNLRNSFWRYRLVKRRGTFNQQCVAEFSGDIVWFDRANQLWSNSLGEIGYDIRPDLKGIDPEQVYVAVHVSDSKHWICLLDGGNGRLWTYDLDQRQWMPPKMLTAGSSALHSEEIASGDVRLGCALGGTQIYWLNHNRYNDAGTSYTSISEVSLIQIHPEKNADWCGNVDYIAVETNSRTCSDVAILIDDDPTTQAHTSIFGSEQDPIQRNNGVDLVKKQYPCVQPQGQRCSVQLEWDDEDVNFKCYTIDIVSHGVGQ
jgi:hypothetical protein